MAFEGLSERLQATMQKMRGKGKLTEADIKIMMREVRLALLEADVNFKVVKEFIKTVSERALGSDVIHYEWLIRYHLWLYHLISLIQYL